VIGASNFLELGGGNNLATGAGILKTAKALGVGTGTVHMVKREMEAVVAWQGVVRKSPLAPVAEIDLTHRFPAFSHMRLDRVHVPRALAFPWLALRVGRSRRTQLQRVLRVTAESESINGQSVGSPWSQRSTASARLPSL
jgi:hypothetical protein